MKKIEELNPHGYEVDAKTQCHLFQLFDSLIKLQDAYVADGGAEFICTSGLRSQAQQTEMVKTGVSNAPLSKHLLGAAADILDRDGALGVWCMGRGNSKLIELDLYCEDIEAIKKLARKRQVSPWMHFQTLPPKSKKRFFIP